MPSNNLTVASATINPHLTAIQQAVQVIDPITAALLFRARAKTAVAAFAAALPWLGTATEDLQDGPNGGFVQTYANGTVYDSIGIHEVHGAIRDKYNQLAGPAGFLGYPTTDETGAPDGVGRYNHFQGGSIYWTPQTGAFEVHGAIRNLWASLGWERSLLGYPLTDETGAPDGVGRYNHFQGGSVYWTPQIGAHEVHGAIRDRWAALGWERSFFGYPVSDEFDCNGGRCSAFQNGTIRWTADGGTQDLPETFVVNAANITFGTGLPVGGNGTLTLFSDGRAHFQGHLHDSGFPSFDYVAVFVVKDTAGNAFAATHTGRMHGTDEAGNRSSDWDETQTNDLIRQNWPLVRAGSGNWKVDITSDWSPQKIAEDIAAVAGLVVGVVALF